MQDGRLLFSHYAFAPNRLGYCGSDDHRTLLEYCAANEADPGLEQLIREFQMAYPYIQFIAEANNIASPYDPRVVEAYWVGNELLNRVSMKDFYGYLKEKIGPRVSHKAFEYIIGKLPDGAHPHHSFHVFDVSRRTGGTKEEMHDIDRCRISWGEVQRVENDIAVVNYQPVEMQAGKLVLGEPQERRAALKADGIGYLTTPQPGDMVSLHWEWVCDFLTPAQVARLESQTRHHMELANTTI